ncbi:MAG: helix-turn-helix domain-containing protein [Oscillospiraceae bacterium]
MKLSLWMIANRLKSLEPILKLSSDSTPTLRSARRAYATNCAYVHSNGTDAVCEGPDGQIVLPNTDQETAFELIQHIFDFYNEWDEAIRDAVSGDIDFQRLIDLSFSIFQNPISISNQNMKILALTEQYGENDVDEEWKSICKNRFSSLSALRFFREHMNQYDFSMSRVQVIHMIPGRMAFDCIVVPLVCNNNQIGHIGIIEKDSKFNPGYVQAAEYLGSVLSSAMGRSYQNRIEDSFPFCASVLSGNASQQDLLRFFEYRNWNPDSELQICVIQISHQDDNNGLLLMSQQVQKRIPFCDAFIFQNKLCALINLSLQSTCEFLDDIVDISGDNDISIGLSLPFSGMSKIAIYHTQACDAITYICKPVKGTAIKFFYDCAIDNIIEKEFNSCTVWSCQPDILRISSMPVKSACDLLYTLEVYLKNERNLVNTAHQLFIHRNTLVYRLHKIEELLKYPLSDPYTREYMLLSLRILNKIDTVLP